MEKQEIQPKLIESIKDLIPKYKAFIFDVDGVIWQGTATVKSAAKAFNHLLNIGKIVCVYTNSTCSREVIQGKLKESGVELPIENIKTAGHVVAMFLKEKGYKKVFVIGLDSDKELIRQEGIEVVSELTGNDGLPKLQKENLHKVKFQDGIEAIVNQFSLSVASSDFQLNFLKIFYALTCFRKGAKFYATKMDHIDCYDDKQNVYPSGGVIVKALEYAFQSKPILLGKPSPLGLEMFMKEKGLKPSECLFTGDSLLCDIKMGNDTGTIFINFPFCQQILQGIDTHFVFTGVQDATDIKKLEIYPTYMSEALSI